ncbi:MAG: ribokinase [Microcoleaceae cyanobacterium]
MSLIVFGSLNMDLVAKTPRLPTPGETVQGESFLTAPGGKGANQAVAAARLGAVTYLVGRVGDDQFGSALLTGLKADKVNIEQVLVDSQTPSGVAMITVNQSSENTIIVIAGANGKVDETDVQRILPLFSNTTALLLQLEIPLSAVMAAAKAAYNAGIKVILDPAPAPDSLPDELYGLIDIITPNETEAQRLTGIEITDKTMARKAAAVLLSRGVKTAVIKLGARGVFCMNSSQQFYVEPFAVEAVDTVAAGDAFNGAMATALDRNLSLREAVIWGAAAGALTTTKSGAQPALPNWEILSKFLHQST